MFMQTLSINIPVYNAEKTIELYRNTLLNISVEKFPPFCQREVLL